MRHRLPSVLLFLSIAGCSHETGDGTEPALETGSVRITSVSADTTGSEVVVRVRVENGTRTPVFAITSPRKIAYRADRNLLELGLLEEPMPPSGTSADCHYMTPMQKELGALRAATFEIRLPRVQKHLVDWNTRTVVDEPLYASKQVDVALGWSDVPLVPDEEVTSQCRFEMSQNVWAKQRGVTRGTWKTP